MSGISEAERTESIAYVSEAKGIQRYVFDSGPLRDVVGASDLVAGLASSDGGVTEAAVETAYIQNDLIGRVCQAVPGGGEVVFSRRAGGSFALHAESPHTVCNIRALWRLATMLRCVGLELSDSVESELLSGPTTGQSLERARLTALKKAYASGSGIRHGGVAELPPAGHPKTLFVPRTGRPATGISRYGKSGGHEDVLADTMTAPQRIHAARLADLRLDRIDRIASSFLGVDTKDQAGNPFRFPRNLDSGDDEPEDVANPQFPFVSEHDTRLAIVHADVSGLGQTFQRASTGATKTAELFALGSAIERAIGDAAYSAASILRGAAVTARYGATTLAVIPARPILLGGDDITILIRADLALPFTKALLGAIESASRQTLADWKKDFASAGDIEQLTACAGVAVIRRGQPFTMANELASQLCNFAKSSVKRLAKIRGLNAPPSALAFHLVSTTLQESYTDFVLPREMTSATGRLTNNPYLLGSGDGKAYSGFDDICALATEIGSIASARSSLRDLRRIAFVSAGELNSAWIRWREVVGGENRSDADKSVLHQVDACLLKLGVAHPVHSPIGEVAETKVIPLFDALDLIDIGLLKVEEKRS